MATAKTRIYVPTLYEAISLTIVGAVLLVTGVLLSAAKNYDVQNYNFFSTTGKAWIDNKLNFLDSPRWSTIITFLLWMICGILVYIAIWFVSNLITSYKEDSLPLHGFLTPRGYDRSKEVSTAIARVLIRFVSVILTIVWLTILLRSTMPYLTHVFAAALSPITFSSVPTIFVASVLLGACLYVLIVFIRFIFLRKRLFSRNITD